MKVCLELNHASTGCEHLELPLNQCDTEPTLLYFYPSVLKLCISETKFMSRYMAFFFLKKNLCLCDDYNVMVAEMKQIIFRCYAWILKPVEQRS